MKRSLNIALTIFALSGSALAFAVQPTAAAGESDQKSKPFDGCCMTASDIVGKQQVQTQQAYIDVVFVLDTTGSMGGLIEGAKQKIWSIANAISQTQQTPVIRFGLVGYRDRGDEYVTKMTPLTEDIDTMYADLMGYQARGGGDTPESVNEALFQAVERFDWTEQDGALKLIYLVGDAPPKMEYVDDVKYQASCKMAKEKRININTIQCGSIGSTDRFWQEISQLANGSYAKIEQSGGVVAIATPYDKQLAELNQEFQRTMIDYGDRETRSYQYAKRTRSDSIRAGAAPEAEADRAVYNISSAGTANAYGKQELVNDVVNGTVKIQEVKKNELPEQLQSLTLEEIKAEIKEKQIKREEITKRIKDLADKRAAYLQEHTPDAVKDGFDQKVLDALIEQGARVGIEFKADAEPKADGPKEKPNAPAKD